MIKVLIVDDSSVVVEFLTYLLQSDSNIRVVGTAMNGIEAIESVRKFKPDVITMDVFMPKMDGVEATKKIMETEPTPIIIVSGNLNAQEISTPFNLIEAGALAIVQRPFGLDHPEHERMVKDLIKTVKLMSEIKVIRRWSKNKIGINPVFVPSRTHTDNTVPEAKIIGIGASTGGPIAIKQILSKLPKNFSIPILIVQHIASGFVDGFVNWLNSVMNFKVKVADPDEIPVGGCAYVAGDKCQMGINPDGSISLSGIVPEYDSMPSVSHLFRSISDLYGKNAVGILLSGMGKDGADGLKVMRDKGSITFAQDEESSVVFGMPQEAIKLNAATFILPPLEIAEEIIKLNRFAFNENY